METTVHTIKNDIETTATSHIFEALQYIDPITTDMDEDEITGMLRDKLEHYPYDGIITYYEAFLVVGSSEFPSADYVDFSGCNSSLDCLMREANDIAYQAYTEALNNEIEEVLERIIAIKDKAVELGFDGAFVISSSSLYGWAVHNYETECGICVWSDEQCEGCYNPELLEGESWAIESSVAGLHMGACWTPEAE